jgi:hypothetical protein
MLSKLSASSSRTHDRSKDGGMVETGLQADPRWQLIERIVASPHFARSARLVDFLIYVARETILERGTQLNEQKIGVAIFDRSLDYDSAEDNIVRSHASRLRQRLEAYFTENGNHELLHVSMLRGSYVLHFEQNEFTAAESQELPPESVPLAAPTAASGTASSAFWKLNQISVILLSILLVLATVAVDRLWLLHTWGGFSNAKFSTNSPTLHALWSEVFPAPGRTLIIPADSSLVLYQDILTYPIELRDYANKSFLTGSFNYPPHNSTEIANLVIARRLTSVADLELTASLLQIPEAVSAHPQIRFARDLQMADLKESNAVIIGGEAADPWLTVFQSKINFVISADLSSHQLDARVLNRSPHPGEQAVYLHDPSDGAHKTYAVIAMVSNLSGNGVVLIIEGTSIAGTEAASEFITNRNEIEPVLAPLYQKYNRIPPFEVLLESTDLNGTAPQSKVLALRVNP